jgi:hypothetical protein
MSEENRVFLGQELTGILEAYDSMLEDRWKRIEQINDAYNMYPDPDTQGLRPDASALVSEMTRSKVKAAAAREFDSIRSTRPFMQVVATDYKSADPNTEKRVDEARAMERFFDFYTFNELDGNSWIRLGILGKCKVGTQILRVMWEEIQSTYSYMGSDGVVEDESESGGIKVDLVRLRDFVCWPVSEVSIEKMLMVGHRFCFATPSSFKAFCKDKGVSEELCKEIISSSEGNTGIGSPESDVEGTTEKDLLGKDVHRPGFNPLKSEIALVEIWGNMDLPGSEDGPTKFQCFLHEQTKKVLWIGKNTLNSRRHPYFALHHWREQDIFFSTGLGQELLYQQKADTSLQNMGIDNLKMMGNHVRVLRANSQAEVMQDQIAPGINIVTEDIEQDFKTVALGGDLDLIYEAQENQERRGQKLTGVTNPLQGMADETLKSGASPGSQGQLIGEASRQFKDADTTTRAAFSDMYLFMLELIQQYATEGLWYGILSEEDGRLMKRIKFQPPFGSLRRLFRLEARAPSAATNSDVIAQNLMVMQSLLAQQGEGILQLAQVAWGDTEPIRVKKLAHDLLSFGLEIAERTVQQYEIPGLAAAVPKAEELNYQGQVANALFQELQQLKGALMQVQGGASGPSGMVQAG